MMKARYKRFPGKVAVSIFSYMRLDPESTRNMKAVFHGILWFLDKEWEDFAHGFILNNFSDVQEVEDRTESTDSRKTTTGSSLTVSWWGMRITLTSRLLAFLVCLSLHLFGGWPIRKVPERWLDYLR